MIADLFAGPGGLDEAARQLGLPTVGIEHDADAVTTRTAAGHATIHADVRHHGPDSVPDATVLAAGPPCQTYSHAGDGSGRRALAEVLDAARAMAARQQTAARWGDERTGLVLEPLRWALTALDDGQPYRAVVLEQVPAVLPVWQVIGAVLAREGYGVATGVLRAEEYGVPQTRRRAVLVARLDGRTVLPEPTHRPWRQEPDLISIGLPRWISQGDALSRPEPFVVVSNYGTGGDPRNRGRRRSDEPAFTVTSKISRNRVLSADGTRELPRLSHSEAGLLQGFPADYPWSGRDVAQQIGNAIPPPLARALITAATTP
ncbi:DNA cytosine methyltransferase [Streptomyces sp. NBRC 109706]|uniref:DNA cytosine methyltransferase n=1 Tax=Streptomyces sp. NBRC 109706 TaxID=1550035 RepID=UPI00078251DB|nr:DNA cytosine methyltransferase [Streptomyces sp. NBRC 109706]